jgi:hypothetical protein
MALPLGLIRLTARAAGKGGWGRRGRSAAETVRQIAKPSRFDRRHK